jgi:hypothetical protein
VPQQAQILAGTQSKVIGCHHTASWLQLTGVGQLVCCISHKCPRLAARQGSLKRTNSLYDTVSKAPHDACCCNGSFGASCMLRAMAP